MPSQDPKPGGRRAAPSEDVPWQRGGTLLTGLDDQLIHQLPRPFAVVADRASNWFDRFYFSLHPRQAGPALVLGVGRYANAGVMDGYACLVADEEQRNVRVARRIARGEAPTELPLLRWEVIEPLRRWRLVVEADREEGFALDAVWTARTGPFAIEPIAVAHADGLPTEFSHFFQPGRWDGVLRIDGHEHDVGGWLGMRDRSWGVRRTRERLGMHLWGGAQLSDRVVAVSYNEGRDGQPMHVDGAVLHADDRSPVAVVEVRHDLVLDDGGELLDGRLLLSLENGETVEVEWQSLGSGVYMSAAGYDGWHGQDRGDRHVEHERWQLGPSVRPKDLPIALVDKLCSCRVGDESGTGIFELAVSRSPSYRYRPTVT